MLPRNLPPVLAVLIGLLTAPVLAFVGFVTISPRQDVRLLIYNSEDLTLVRDERRAVFRQGDNSLRYAWANTLIDPTSLRTFAPPGVRLVDTTYPLDDGESLVWAFDAGREVSGPLKIDYFTSGLSWRADHVATVQKNGKIDLETWVRVDNHSGEDYPGARVSLVVGEVRLVESIRSLAEQFKPRPEPKKSAAPTRQMMYKMAKEEDMATGGAMPPQAPMPAAAGGVSQPKEVVRESLSELHVYRIEGTETIPTGGARRMRAFTYKNVVVTDVYRCNDPRGKEDALRVLSFENKKENEMGTQPLPEGTFQVYRDDGGVLAYQGRGNLPYTPMEETAEVPLGTTPGVQCVLHVENVAKENVEQDRLGRIIGWEDVTFFRLHLVNGADRPVTFEVRQHHPIPFETDLQGSEKEDVQTLLLEQPVPAHGDRELRYAVRVKRGTLAQKGGER